MADDFVLDSPTWSLDPTAQGAIEARSHPEPNSGCWLWVKAVDRDGYGRFQVRGEYRAHRAAFKAFRGPIPDSLWVLHKCDTPACVNPDHLFLGTVVDNNADRKIKGRAPLGEKNGAYTSPARRPRGERHGSYTKPWTRKVGEKNGRALITEAQAKMILAFKGPHGWRKRMAKDLGVSYAAICDLLHGRSWKHLERRHAN